jgi:predicted nucleotidyltransferase
MSAVDFLLTPAVQKVLAAIYAQPTRSFTFNELIKRADSGKGSVQLQIDRLITAGVLVEEPRRGNQRSIKANTSFFLYPELLSIARKSFAIAEPLRAALQPFADRIDEAFVFGSMAKSTDSHHSDIDLIAVGDASLLELTEALSEVEQAIGRPVHLSLYTSREWSAVSTTDPILSQISSGSRIQILPDDTAPRIPEPH